MTTLKASVTILEQIADTESNCKDIECPTKLHFIHVKAVLNPQKLATYLEKNEKWTEAHLNKLLRKIMKMQRRLLPYDVGATPVDPELKKAFALWEKHSDELGEVKGIKCFTPIKTYEQGKKDENKDWIAGRRCTCCGCDKEPSLADLCRECFESAIADY